MTTDQTDPASTIDEQITSSDYVAAYQFGYSAGSLYATKNPHSTDPNFARFARWRRANREKLTPDSLRQMSAALREKPDITQPEAETWLLSFAAFIPPTHDLQAVLHFIDGWYWGVRQTREHARQAKIQAEVARRRQEEAEEVTGLTL
jgi:hypothetical protein